MKRWFFLLVSFSVFLLWACGDTATEPEPDPDPPVASQLVKVAGDSQTAVVATMTGQSLVVQVKDQHGEPMHGATVAWGVISGDGSLSATSSTTDADGRAAVDWTLGTAAGVNEMRANVTAVAGLTFTAEGVPDRPATIALSMDSVSFSAVGDTAHATATVVDQYENEISDPPILWSSADASIAGVTESGAIISNGAGTATVSAVADTASDRVVVVVDQSTAEVRVTQSADSLFALQDTLRLTATAYDRNGNVIPDESYTWSALDTAVVDIDTTGLATAQSNGTGQVTARAGDAADTAEIVVAQVPTAIAVSPTADTMDALGDSIQITANVTDANGFDVLGESVSWDTSDTTIVELAAAGQVISRGVGNAEVVAVSGELEDTAVIHVRQVVATVDVTPAGESIEAGATLQLSASASDANGVVISGTSFTWASSDTAVASVDGNGLVTGKLANAADITSTAAGVADTASVTVTPGSPVLLVAVTGDGQTGPAGEPLADSVAVKLEDDYGNAVPGAAVHWAVNAGHGTVSADSSTTGADGIASVQWELGPTSGTDTLTATRADIEGSPSVFTATATPNGTISGTVTLTSSLQSLSATTLEGRLAEGDSEEDLKQQSILSGSSGPEPRNAAAPSTGEPEYVPGSLIVTYRPDILRAGRTGLAAMTGLAAAAEVAGDIRTRVAARAAALDFQINGVSPVIFSTRIRVDPDRLEEVRNELLADPDVAAVQRETLVRRSIVEGSASAPDAAAAPSLPADPAYAAQAWHYSMIDLPEAWEITTGSAAVVVAVVDDGIRFDHPDISPNLTDDGYDFVSQQTVSICGSLVDRAYDGDGYDSDPTIPLKVNESSCTYATAAGHGLHVAGTIGAVGNNGVGVSGVNWHVKIRPIRALGIDGSGSDYDIAQAILYAAGLPADDGAGGQVQAATKAPIINLSLGGSSSSLVLENAVKAAADAGSLLIASAGNDNTSIPNYPSAYPEVVSVSAVGPDRTYASYSNYGSTIEIAAPGGDGADGNSTYKIASTLWDFSAASPTYGWSQGTSMAAPHVAGVAALLLAAEPSLTATELRSRLVDYAVDLGPAGRDNDYGYGLVNARNSLTQSFAPTRDLYAQLYDASTGAVVDKAAVNGDGSFEFSALEDGDYWVFAGQDNEGDGQIGVAGRRWGSYSGTSAIPSVVTVAGAGTYPASFSAGFPYEYESNDTQSLADILVPGGYIHGLFSSTSDQDVYKITVSAGQYSFETSGWDGACGYAYEADTVLELYDASSTLLTSNDDIDAGNLNYCSRITQTLSEGTYYLVVSYASGGIRYRLEARPGS